jgi:Xaa-Pro aminopeptidase
VRLEKLRNSLADQHLDAILISQPENRRYLSGFSGSAGWLLITSERQVLATDFRYYEQAAQEAATFELAKITTRFPKVLPDLMADFDIKRLGFESQHVCVDDFHTWSEAVVDVEWVPLKDVVERLRAVKDEGEIDALRRSAAITDAAFCHLLDVLEPGMTERQAAWEIESHMRTHGATKVAFDRVVAAGPNGARPHARPGDRVIEAGEPIVIDIGCVLDGYCSDMTRTFCLGKPSPEYMRVWETVLEAQEAAETAVHAGMSAVEADALARDLIAEAGHADHFGHGLGHGVGLAVHEAPWASRLSEETLEAGMTLTIEPGIYLPGKFGVRIEDLVIVRQKNVEILSSAPKTPVVD